MTKELEALKEIRDRFGKEILFSSWTDDTSNIAITHEITTSDYCDIIEAALIQAKKDKKELEDLKSAINQGVITSQWTHDYKYEKELKTLEIIKNKQINVHTFLLFCFNRTFEEYCYLYHSYKECDISKEPLFETEYRLLKEVLLCG